MNRLVLVIVLAIVIVNVVGFSVFLTGNSPSVNSMNSTNVQQSQSGQTETQDDSITLEELSDHDSKTDCWIAYKGKVYDLTAWLPNHPGSSAAIEPYCGTSEEFEAAFTGQHGTSQLDRMMEESIYKGDLQ